MPLASSSPGRLQLRDPRAQLVPLGRQRAAVGNLFVPPVLKTGTGG